MFCFVVIVVVVSPPRIVKAVWLKCLSEKINHSSFRVHTNVNLPPTLTLTSTTKKKTFSLFPFLYKTSLPRGNQLKVLTRSNHQIFLNVMGAFEYKTHLHTQPADLGHCK